jgi:hypothetical protein
MARAICQGGITPMAVHMAVYGKNYVLIYRCLRPPNEVKAAPSAPGPAVDGPSGTRQEAGRQHEEGRVFDKQNETKQNKTKQNKRKQNKT